MSPKCAKSTKTILVIDDDSSVVRMLVEILGRYGYRVLEAESVEDAIKVIKARLCGVDLLLIDAVMPNMSGPELADILLFLRPDMKVIFITGLDSLAIRLAFDRPCGFIQKPFTAGFLVSKVQEALGDATRSVN